MIKRTLFNRLGMLTAVTGLLLASGCDAPGDEAAGDAEQGIAAQPEAAEPNAEAQPDRHGPHGRHGKKGRHGKHGKFGKKGAPGLLGAALHKLTLSAEQQTKIESLIAGVKGDKAAHAEAHKAFREAMAAGVESGKIDPAIVDTHLTAMDAKMSDKRDKMNSALNELHATLTPEQRSELATAMRSKMDRAQERFGAFDGPPDRDDDGDDATAGEPPRDRRDKRGPRGKRGKRGKRGGKMVRLLRRLDLTDEQREQLREARKANRPERPEPEQRKAKREEHRAKMTTMLAAFESDSFDAAALDMGAGKRDKMRQHLEHEVSSMNAALPILTAEQRTELAQLLRKGPRRGPGKR